MAGKRKGTDKMVIKDGAVDFNPRRAKKKHLDEELLNNETGQLDENAGMGKKRKRPIPKELRKRKQQKMDEETVSESEVGGQKEQKEKKKSRVGEGAKAETGLHGDDDSDTASSTSQVCCDEQDDDDDDDRDSTSEEEPMDCEEAREHPISDTSLPKSILKPEGSKTHRGYSTTFRSVEQHFTSAHGKQVSDKRDRAVFDEADTALLRTSNEIRMSKRDTPYSSSYKDSESISSRKSIKKTTGTSAPYLGYHHKIRQRHNQQHWQDKVRRSEESIFPLQRNTNIKTGNTYVSSAYTRKNKVEMTNRKERGTSCHRYAKSCVCLVLLILLFVMALATFTSKNYLVDNVMPSLLRKIDLVDDFKSSLFTKIGHVGDVGSSTFSFGCQKRERSDRFDVLLQEQDLLHQQYPTLKESVFTVVAGASFDHVEEHRELVRPVVLLLVGKQGGKTNVHDVAASVARMYLNVFLLKRPENDVVRINGLDLEKYPSDEARKEVHTRIEEGFRNCSNVVLITDLDRLPPCSAILFHGYCDNDGAPYKDAVFIFTVKLETELAEDAHAADVEKAVQAQLDEAWGRCPEEFSSAKMVAMHSRIANNIVPI